MHDRPSPASDKAASDMVKTSVLVVGGGPVGLTLAMDLATRGISVAVVETRAAGEAPSVKCNHVSSRSMETFRRLGLAQKLRDTGLPAEPPHRINQIHMEPVLLAHAASIDGLAILNRTAFEEFSERDDGIVATVRNLDTGTASQIHADFIVGCDGARSLVRKAIDANLQGTPIIQRVQSTYIHAPT